MLKQIQYKNFRILKNATLPLEPFTLIVGANGSGKSTAMRALTAVIGKQCLAYQQTISAGVKGNPELVLQWRELGGHGDFTTQVRWEPGQPAKMNHSKNGQGLPDKAFQPLVQEVLKAVKIHKWESSHLAAPASISENPELSETGQFLAAVLDRLHESEPERFEALNSELVQALPDFDRIMLKTVASGQKQVALRTAFEGYQIPAPSLSDGTLFFLAILTLAHGVDPAPIICFEEPDNGIHPRLLRRVQEALYRLSYPEKYGEKRKPIQVIATTHSPYFLDLFKDSPQEVAIAKKEGEYATFERLSDMSELQESLHGAPLGEIWYSGVLGGVPIEK